MSLEQVVECFRALKAQGATADIILDILEFDSDEYPNQDVLEQAKRIVFGQ